MDVLVGGCRQFLGVFVYGRSRQVLGGVVVGGAVWCRMVQRSAVAVQSLPVVLRGGKSAEGLVLGGE